jgi:hypothetical protein
MGTLDLEIGEYSCFEANVDCYNQGKITMVLIQPYHKESLICVRPHMILQWLIIFNFKIIIVNRAWIAEFRLLGLNLQLKAGAVIEVVQLF